MKKSILTIFLFLSFFISRSQNTTKYIVVDQFGYRISDPKFAVIRDPQVGFDASETFVPGTSYSLVSTTGSVLLTKNITVWNMGVTDTVSGDKAWWFDFSEINTVGDYYVLDNQNNVRSAIFSIADDVYDNVLKHAVRSFFYQRVGCAKKSPFAEIGWEDDASHIAALQDKNCRPYNDKNNLAKEKNLSGGWYDAGDYNKYTTWTANYVYEMLQAYEENTKAWTDDYNLPNSGNGIPDLIDEAKWGMDHLLRLQNTDGSVISIVDLDHASPPSAAKGQSLYGAVNTSCTWSTAGAYAYGAKVFRKFGLNAYADSLQAAAVNAYTWAEANPAVIWRNNDATYNSSGIGSGQQEVDDYTRLSYRLRACTHLFENTSDAKYKTFFESNYTEIHLMPWYYAYPYETREQETVLYYTGLQGITSTVKTTIIGRYTSAMTNNDDNLKALANKRDPYKSHLGSYVWGSNSTKANHGNMFMDAIKYTTNASKNTDLKQAALDYIHYIHGVNPLNKCYLSNMNTKGADNSVSQFYHTWFTDKSTKWDEVGVSTYGPAPGFLVGGANPSYNWDACCDGSCGSTQNTAICTSMSINPPKGQPAPKSYLDFNTNWPLNSWEVTENSCGYQMAYIRLLSKFVDRSAIINGVGGGVNQSQYTLALYPNPASESIKVSVSVNFHPNTIKIFDVKGNLMLNQVYQLENISVKELALGTYLVQLIGDEGLISEKLVVE